MKSNYKNCTFFTSAANLSGCPESIREVAFAGRSNAGKSSALNYLTQQKIAKTSKTPGRTQLINFFALDEGYFLVDLPGYGYAKVSRTTREAWQQNLTDYLAAREPLIGLVIVMDCRHPFQPIDEMMLDFCGEVNLLAHVVLTKADKLSRSQQQQTLIRAENRLRRDWDFASAQLLSSSKKQGAETLSRVLDDWLYTDYSSLDSPYPDSPDDGLGDEFDSELDDELDNGLDNGLDDDLADHPSDTQTKDDAC